LDQSQKVRFVRFERSFNRRVARVRIMSGLIAVVVEARQIAHGNWENKKVESVEKSLFVGGRHVKQGDSSRTGALVITPVFQPPNGKLGTPSEQRVYRALTKKRSIIARRRRCHHFGVPAC
jgi:hypothetical protein